MPKRGSVMICHDPDSTARPAFHRYTIYCSAAHLYNPIDGMRKREKGWSVVRKRALVRRGNE